MIPDTASIASTCHREYFGSDASALFSAPGRVNLIGEHTDYNDGFVMPCAIDFYTSVAISPNGTDIARVIATNFENAEDQFSLVDVITQSSDHWPNYVRGVVNTLLEQGHNISGFDMTIAGDIPQGTGLSSSASLEVVTGTALNHTFQLDLSPTDIALIGQRAENAFVGCSCGIMDQLISAKGIEQSALLIDCRSLESTSIELPDSLELVIINPNVERNLVGSEYNTRRASCELAANTIGVKALRDADLNALNAIQDQVGDETYRRARHIITENDRVLRMQTAMKQADLSVIHQLLVDSHESMKNDFEITSPELDYVADYINERCASEGGCRMTGGGFGGCAVALLTQSVASEVLQSLAEAYRAKWNKPIDFYHCQLVNGASQIKPN